MKNLKITEIIFLILAFSLMYSPALCAADRPPAWPQDAPQEPRHQDTTTLNPHQEGVIINDLDGSYQRSGPSQTTANPDQSTTVTTQHQSTSTNHNNNTINRTTTTTVTTSQNGRDRTTETLTTSQVLDSEGNVIRTRTTHTVTREHLPPTDEDGMPVTTSEDQGSVGTSRIAVTTDADGTVTTQLRMSNHPHQRWTKVVHPDGSGEITCKDRGKTHHWKINPDGTFTLLSAAASSSFGDGIGFAKAPGSGIGRSPGRDVRGGLQTERDHTEDFHE